MSFSAQAQTVLHGRILDEKGLIFPEVLVQLSPQNGLETTDSSGQFWFENLPEGLCTLTIEVVGYQTEQKIIAIPKNTPHLDVEIQLLPLTNDLQVVNVEDLEQKTLAQHKVDKRFFLDNLAGNFAQSLSNIAGLQAINVGVGVAKPVIRGLTGNRILVLNDGIKQEGQQWGNDHGLEMDALDVESMQLVKGAAALQYGSDAMAGVLILNPLKIPAQNTLSASILSLYKSNNQHAGLSAQISGRTQRFFAQFRYSLQRYSDYQMPADSFSYNGFRLPIYNQRLKNTAGRESNLRLTTGWVFDRGISRISLSLYQVEAGIFMGAVAIPRTYSLQPDNSYRDIDIPQQKVSHFKANLHHLQRLNPNNSLTVDAGFQQNTRQEFSYSDRHNRPPAGDRNLALNLGLKTLSLDVSVKNTQSKHSILYGIQTQYQQNEATGFEFLIPSYQNAKAAAFAMAEYSPTARFLCSFGLRADASGYSATQFEQQVYNLQNQIVTISRFGGSNRSFFNYAANIGGVFSPTTTQKWRLNLGKSFRSPALNELTANGIHHGTFRHERGNPNLNPEQGYQLDFSYQKNSSGVFASISGALYANYFQNFIFLRPSGQFSSLPEGGQVYQYSQAAVFHTGGELEWTLQPHKAVSIHQNIEYVYNYNLNTGLSLPFTPPLNLFTELKMDCFQLFAKNTHFKNSSNQPTAFINISHLYSAAQNLTDRNELATPAYHLFHAAANFKLPISFKNRPKYTQAITFSLQVQNVFNTAYLQHLSRYRLLNLPEQGRNFILSVYYEL